jgi:hypothetical protein
MKRRFVRRVTLPGVGWGMNTTSSLLFAASTLILVGGTAFADDPAEPGADPAAPAADPAAPPEEVVQPEVEATPVPLTPALPEGGDYDYDDDDDRRGGSRLSFDAEIQIGLSSGRSGDPFSISPDIWWIPEGKLPSIGLVHSSTAITGFRGVMPGGSLCLGGDTCDALHTYHNVGLEARMPIAGAAKADTDLVAFGINGGPVITAFDPELALDAKLGATLIYAHATGAYVPIYLMVELSPNVLVALTNRDSSRDRINVPIKFSIARALGIETGVTGPLDGFGASYQIPVSAFLVYPVTDWLQAHVAFTLPAVTAGDEIMTTGWDARVLTIGFSIEKGLGGR